MNSSRNVEYCKYAFVVPTYNYARFIVRALDSIFCQKSNDFQVIVMDDGSTDETKSLLLDRYSYKSNFYYYYQNNRGPNVACSEAIRKSNAKYVIFMAADDSLRPDYLEHIDVITASDPSLDVVFGQSCSISSDGKRRKVSSDVYPLSDPLECFRSFILGEVSATTCGTLVRRKVMDDYIDYPGVLPQSFDVVVVAHFLLKHRCFQTQSVFVDVYDHNQRFRNNISAVKNDANLVEVMFNSTLLGGHQEALRYKADFYAKNQKSRGRSFYRNRMWSEALEAYSRVVKMNTKGAVDSQVIKRMSVSYVMSKWEGVGFQWFEQG
ncbi:hypothetical protein A9Q81_07335 [Gammaproteobacteria bacterium 42_54_T18]|nr:hypothetical protein A9Q81_07335 [Gammaproteobacteria bacterium 42_54_T18]